MLLLLLLAVAEAQIRTEDNCFEIIENCRGGNCGAPYHIATTANRDDCLNLCRADPRCAGVEYDQAGAGMVGNCRMKNVLPGTQFPYIPFYRQGGFGGFGGFGGGGFGGGGFGSFFDTPNMANTTTVKKFWEKHLEGNSSEQHIPDGQGGEIVFPEELPPVKGAPLSEEDIRQVVENEKKEDRTAELNSPMGQMGLNQPFFFHVQGRQTFRWTGLCVRGAVTPKPVVKEAEVRTEVKPEDRKEE